MRDAVTDLGDDGGLLVVDGGVDLGQLVTQRVHNLARVDGV